MAFHFLRTRSGRRRLLQSLAVAALVGTFTVGCGHKSKDHSARALKQSTASGATSGGTAGVGSGSTGATGSGSSTTGSTGSTGTTKAQYLVTISVPQGGGTVDVDPPSQNNLYDEGTLLTFTARPDAVSTFKAWGGDLVGSVAIRKVVIRKDLTVLAQFDSSAGSGIANAGTRFWHEGDQFGNPLKRNDQNEDFLARQVLDLVNNERVAAGLNPVLWDDEAMVAAKVHSEDMAGRGFFDHISPDGWDPGDRLDMTGATGYRGFGENIAQGYRSAASVMDGWMNSPGHRANILEPSFTHLGVGLDIDTHTWTQVFLTR